MSTIVSIQARLGSTRLPNKMKLSLGGETVLSWVIKRASLSNEVDLVVLALPDTPENDELEMVAQSLGCLTYRGSENDVLERLTLSVREYQPDNVVRLCADRPLVDPTVLDDTVKFFRDRYKANQPIDLAFSHQAGRGADWPFGFGVEVLSYSCLERLNEIVTDPFEREHVTLHLWNHSDRYQIKPLPCPSAYSILGPNAKLDLDTSTDFLRLKKLILSPEDVRLPGYEFITRALNI